MTKPSKLNSSELAVKLNEVPGWSVAEGKLTREFKLGSFRRAFALMTQVAAFAEEMQHHPEWFNVYDFVRIQLTTHDAQGISIKDFELAQKIDAALASLPKT